MNIRQIEAFHAVMATGSMTRAGERMSISQPAVSQLIAQFEKRCGFRLFDREGSRIIPTREAEALFIEVQRMSVGVGQIARVATALRERTWGALSVAAFPAIARRVVPQILWDFCKSRPDTNVRIQSIRSRGLIDAVAVEQVDIGISSLPSDRPEVESRRLHRLRGVCILPSTHPLAERKTIHAADLSHQPFVSLGPQDHSRFMIDRVFDEWNVPRVVSIEAGQAETAFTFVAAGAGVAVVDPISVYNTPDSRIVVRRFEPAVGFDVWLIKPAVARPFNLIDAALDFIVDRLAVFVTGRHTGSTFPFDEGRRMIETL